MGFFTKYKSDSLYSVSYTHLDVYKRQVVDKASLPDELNIDAISSDGAIMAISHYKYPIYGIQFHPEAVLTENGHEILNNFIAICQQWRYKNCL